VVIGGVDHRVPDVTRPKRQGTNSFHQHDDRDVQVIRRENTQSPAKVEATETDRASPTFLFQQERCDQEPRDDDEDADPERTEKEDAEHARDDFRRMEVPRPEQMGDQHQRNGKSPETVETENRRSWPGRGGVSYRGFLG
jgi:hypothetical protein